MRFDSCPLSRSASDLRPPAGQAVERHSIFAVRRCQDVRLVSFVVILDLAVALPGGQIGCASLALLLIVRHLLRLQLHILHQVWAASTGRRAALLVVLSWDLEGAMRGRSVSFLRSSFAELYRQPCCLRWSRHCLLVLLLLLEHLL